MQWDRLVVVHQRKSPDASAPGEWLPPPAIFRVETCLRRLCIGDAGSLPTTVASGLSEPPPVERFRATAAYEFLLSVASGLESEIAGESEVFGQFRDAWAAFERAQADCAHELRPFIQRVFEDVKEIRARHLQHAGTITYGGLARHLLGASAGNSTLLVGAGNMAQSVAPYLAQRTLRVWNRTHSRAEALVDRLRPGPAGVRPAVLAATLADELEAWRTVSNVVVCVPSDPERDALRIAAWNENPKCQRLLHLGLIDPAGTPWQEAHGLATLGDLFSLQSTHTELRTVQLGRARAACREKARLRSLGGPASLAHGWEDLSLFANTA